ncbi:CheR family methyltransferase [Anaeroselena agilis]|uniref:protein-glutamate O-methyltransferase n=1 Tax=Anaeroselena agilis TaxID=3063788 RepID=A0ABU3NV31_9FIRM|nr:protein-glutamate O-methyltransferase CheR [Selenomonadales bacterium 4137-cl]
MVTITETEFEELARYIKSQYGIRLGQEKKSLVLGRLGNLLSQQGFATFSEYFGHIMADKTGSAASTLVNRITTNHTYFMRETKHFDYFRTVVLPYLQAHVKDRDLRIWSAGCSTGEEPYTLSMIIDEYFGLGKNEWDTKLLATDISETALNTARQGIYRQDDVATLPAAWRAAYTKKLDSERRAITETIKNEVIFRRLNLMDASFPFKKKFHVIFCRNVMIYFDARTRNELVRKFYDLTEPGGYLFIGHSESLNRDQTGYKYIMPAVYRKERY